MVLLIQTGDLLKNVNQGIIAHGCNAQGVMGAGFAKLIKEKYPQAYKTYASKQSYVLGEIIPVTISNDLIIVNCITQRYYGYKKHVNYDAIRQCLKSLVNLAKLTKLNIHVPLIGGGLAGGDKDTIIEIMNQEFTDINATLWLIS